MPRAEFVEYLFENLLSRQPSNEEQTVCLTFLDEQSQLLTEQAGLSQIEGGPEPAVKASENKEMRARENLVHVLFNHNEFVFIP
ncbi:MAG: hypothetical protein R3C11_04060 [Planctomycetaceae bacterium]